MTEENRLARTRLGERRASYFLLSRRRACDKLADGNDWDVMTDNDTFLNDTEASSRLRPPNLAARLPRLRRAVRSRVRRLLARLPAPLPSPVKSSPAPSRRGRTRAGSTVTGTLISSRTPRAKSTGML